MTKKIQTILVLLLILFSLGFFAKYIMRQSKHISTPIKTARRLNGSNAQGKDFLNNIRRSNSDVPVLMYHYIGDLPNNADQIRRDLTVSTADFSAEMALLQQQGFNS